MYNQKIEMEVLNPVAEYGEVIETVAPRIQDLSGKKIGLFWNGKFGGDVVLDMAAKLLQERFSNIDFVKFNLNLNVSAEDLKQMAQCDAIVSGVGDCGGCSMYLGRDSLALEKLGRPVTMIITTPFKRASLWMAESKGRKTFPIVDIPHPMAGVPSEIIRERVGAVLDQIIIGLTQTRKEEGSAIEKIAKRPEVGVVRIGGTSNTEVLRAINRQFYEKSWTDGFPIVPPTEEAVQWMLTGTNRDPSEVVGLIPPGNGRATVRNIAINSVMAGAEPEYMPAIIASVEAIADPQFAVGYLKFGAFGLQTTTGPLSPLLVFNGPVAKDIEIASGYGCFGRGHRANATIGRALRLILINAGRAYPGITDMKGQGSSQEFTFCVAEQEENPVYHQGLKPWRPLHIERGFSPEASTVTVFCAWPPISICDFNHCGPKFLDSVVGAITNTSSVPYQMDGQYVLVLNPSHAKCLADVGMSKDDIREYIHANAVMPWGIYKEQYPGPNNLQPRWMSYTNKDSNTVHIFESPKNFDVIVAGGECLYSQVIRAQCGSPTKEIRLAKK